jgi:hypothetical protein
MYVRKKLFQYRFQWRRASLRYHAASQVDVTQQQQQRHSQLRVSVIQLRVEFCDKFESHDTVMTAARNGEGLQSICLRI